MDLVSELGKFEFISVWKKEDDFPEQIPKP